MELPLQAPHPVRTFKELINFLLLAGIETLIVQTDYSAVLASSFYYLALNGP
jgi:hypothetical protein